MIAEKIGRTAPDTQRRKLVGITTGLLLYTGFIVLLFSDARIGKMDGVFLCVLVCGLLAFTAGVLFLVYRFWKEEPVTDERITKIRTYSVKYGAMAALFVVGIILLDLDTGNRLQLGLYGQLYLILAAFALTAVVSHLYLDRRGDAGE